MYRICNFSNWPFVCGGARLAAEDCLVHDGEGEDFAGAGRGFGCGHILRLKKTEFAFAQVVAENDLIGGRADFGAGEIDLIAEGAGGLVESASDGLELAIVAGNMESNELVVAGGAPLGGVKDQRKRSGDNQLAAHASDESVQIFFHEAGGGDVPCGS